MRYTPHATARLEKLIEGAVGLGREARVDAVVRLPHPQRHTVALLRKVRARVCTRVRAGVCARVRARLRARLRPGAVVCTRVRAGVRARVRARVRPMGPRAGGQA